jgi:hypothetical protein
MARNAAMSRQEVLLRKAAGDAQRLDTANAALAGGDIQVAVLIYSRLASSRTPSPSTVAAKEKLSDLQAEAKRKLSALDEKLKSIRRTNSDYVSPGENVPAGKMSPTIERANAALTKEKKSAHAMPKSSEPDPIDEASFDQPVDWQVVAAGVNGNIVALFRKYDALVDRYGDLPTVGTQLEAHVARLRHQPEYAAVLNEMAAAELWELGQKHERDDQLCCAYWVYKEAAELVPAPSALRAKQRFDELTNDPQVVASAETCRQVKQCHELYLRAERLVEVKPENAAELFEEIVRRAPIDSKIYREAKKRLE